MPYEDLEQAARLLVQALHIRERYMAISHQTFPSTTSRFLRSVDSGCPHLLEDIKHEDRKTIEGKKNKQYLYFIWQHGPLASFPQSVQINAEVVCTPLLCHGYFTLVAAMRYILFYFSFSVRISWTLNIRFKCQTENCISDWSSLTSILLPSPVSISFVLIWKLLDPVQHLAGAGVSTIKSSIKDRICAYGDLAIWSRIV